MPSKNHVQGTVQLVRGKDDDLIRWLERIPPGGRNAALKNTLRCGLELPTPAPETTSIQRLESELQTMRDAMSRLPISPRQQPGAVDTTRVDELERTVNEFMKIVSRQLASIVVGAPVEHFSTLEAAPELSIEDRQQRANRLKKAKW